MTEQDGGEVNAEPVEQPIEQQGVVAPQAEVQEAPQEAPAPDVRDAYKLDSEQAEVQPDDTPKGDMQEAEAEFKIVWPEGVEATPEFSAMTTAAAKEAGLDSKAAGVYTAAVLEALNKAEMENIAKTDAELKQEWGSDYQPNMKACKAFLARHAKVCGLTQDDVAVLQSPKGFRLLYSFMSRTGEQAAHGTDPQAASQVDKSWAYSVMHDPTHADYRAFHDVQHPRYGEMHERYNKTMYGV